MWVIYDQKWEVDNRGYFFITLFQVLSRWVWVFDTWENTLSPVSYNLYRKFDPIQGELLEEKVCSIGVNGQPRDQSRLAAVYGTSQDWLHSMVFTMVFTIETSTILKVRAIKDVTIQQ